VKFAIFNIISRGKIIFDTALQVGRKLDVFKYPRVYTFLYFLEVELWLINDAVFPL